MHSARMRTVRKLGSIRFHSRVPTNLTRTLTWLEYLWFRMSLKTGQFKNHGDAPYFCSLSLCPFYFRFFPRCFDFTTDLVARNLHTQESYVSCSCLFLSTCHLIIHIMHPLIILFYMSFNIIFLTRTVGYSSSAFTTIQAPIVFIRDFDESCSACTM